MLVHSADTLSRALTPEQERLVERDRELLSLLRDRPSPDVLVAALNRAQGLGALHQHGLRVRLAPGDLRLRVQRSTGFSGVGVIGDVETDAGEVRRHLEWVGTSTVQDLSQVLLERLQSLGEYYGAAWLDHNRVLADLAIALEVAITSRTTGPAEYHPLLEVLGTQWLLTAYGIEALPVNLRIPAHEYDDPRWMDRVRTHPELDPAEFLAARHVLAKHYLGYPETFPGSRLHR